MGNIPIEVRRLTRNYGKRRGIVDLTFEEGEIFGFLGPNGAGKTTTIRQLMGLMRPTSGTARVFGLDCWDDSRRVKEMVGFLPGDIHFYEKLTGEEMQQLMGAFPKSVMEAFGANNMSTLAGWVGGKYLNVMWPLIMSVFIIMAGAATVAREVERGTIELLLSVPESRTRLLAAKVAALFTGIVVLVAVTIGSIALGAVLVDETLAFENLLALGAVLLQYRRGRIYGSALHFLQGAQ